MPAFPVVHPTATATAPTETEIPQVLLLPSAHYGHLYKLHLLFLPSTNAKPRADPGWGAPPDIYPQLAPAHDTCCLGVGQGVLLPPRLRR